MNQTNRMNELTGITDQLATKNSQWLFLFTLIVLAVVTFIAVRWLVNKLEKATEKAEQNQAAYNVSLVNINAAYNKTATDLAVVLSECRDVIQENTDFIKRQKG